jgi:hypothetical protein
MCAGPTHFSSTDSAWLMIEKSHIRSLKRVKISNRNASDNT